MADLCQPTNYGSRELGEFARQGISVIIPSREAPWLEHNMTYFRDKWGRLPEPQEVATIGNEELGQWRRPPLPATRCEQRRSPT